MEMFCACAYGFDFDKPEVGLRPLRIMVVYESCSFLLSRTRTIVLLRRVGFSVLFNIS